MTFLSQNSLDENQKPTKMDQVFISQTFFYFLGDITVTTLSFRLKEFRPLALTHRWP
jgi:hypothetical protein